MEIGYARQDGGRAMYPYLQMDAVYDDADRIHASYDVRNLGAHFRSLQFKGYFTQGQHWMTDALRSAPTGWEPWPRPVRRAAS